MGEPQLSPPTTVLQAISLLLVASLTPPPNQQAPTTVPLPHGPSQAIVTGASGSRVVLIAAPSSAASPRPIPGRPVAPRWILGRGVIPPTGQLVLPVQTPSIAAGTSLSLTTLVNGAIAPPPTSTTQAPGAAGVRLVPAPGHGLPLLGGQPLDSTPSPWPTVSHGLAPSARWGSFSAPLTTNRWWQNLTLGSTEQTINALPYLIRATSAGLQGCTPIKTFAPTFIFTAFNADVTLGAQETLGASTVSDFDDLSVTVQWRDGARSMTAPIVQGMPYLTTSYEDYTPRMETVHAILSVNGSGAGIGSVHTGTRFEVFMNTNQTWVLYASSPLTLTLDSISSLTASEPYSGTLRAAALEPGTGSLLDAHAGRIPTGGAVSATASGDRAQLFFDWESMGTGPLLMMTLPHHRETLSSPSVPAVSFTKDTIRGPMVGVVGDSWLMTEDLTTITWDSPRPIDPAREPEVRAALAGDIGQAVWAQDTYFGGKQLAKLGRLALMADQLGETSLAATYRSNLAAAMQPWLDGTNPQSLAYDQTYGGIVDSTAVTNPGAGFGQGYYNDHHFHYGYFIYAAAALARGDSAWAATNRSAITHLVRDIANPTSADPLYTKMRAMDWFSGHSWAAGLFEFGDSRNQESTSEAVNAWYGVYLWGLVQGNERLRDLGRLMLALEIRAAKRYWQVPASNTLYPPPFADNKVVGVLWGLKVEYATFFGNNPEFIHGIQMLPFTPISEELLPAQWVSEGYPVFSSNLAGAAEGWKGFIYLAHSIFDKDAAWAEASTLTGYDDGNTRTNTLYFIATRP